MTFIKTNFSYIIIAVLIAVIFLQRSCSTTTKDGKEILKIDGKKYEGFGVAKLSVKAGFAELRDENLPFEKSVHITACVFLSTIT